MDRVTPKRACVGTQRITKNYLLSILPSRPDPTYVIEVSTGQQIRIDSINTINQPLKLKNGFYKYKYLPIETLNPKKLLLSLKDSDWKIKSFNPVTREICFSIRAIRNQCQDSRCSYSDPSRCHCDTCCWKEFSYIVPGYFWK
jgi:hypothetical protein